MTIPLRQFEGQMVSCGRVGRMLSRCFFFLNVVEIEKLSCADDLSILGEKGLQVAKAICLWKTD